jgi:S-adenosylmethionine synthetase
MFLTNGLFTSESVAAGHPDKVCDQISDGILDAFLVLDPHARVACETFAADQKIIVAGEFRTHKKEHFDQVQAQAESIVRRVLKDVGYTSADLDIDPHHCEIEIRFNHQSSQIAAGVDQASGDLGAGDQGLMFGYASDESKGLMPLPWSLSNELLVVGTNLKKNGDCPLKADAKAQVSVRYLKGLPVGVETVVLSWQHQGSTPLEQIRAYLEREVVDQVIPLAMRTAHFRLFINPAGAWTIGGPKGDTGLTGRKIIVDTYGGACPHGGGAFSGKDPSKVDRSGAYMARYVAKHVVASGLAKRCSVQLSYAIGYAQPISVSVDLHGTGMVQDTLVAQAITQVFDLSPAGMIKELNLLRPIYQNTASLGHFGHWRDPGVYLWESTPHIDRLLQAVRGLIW